MTDVWQGIGIIDRGPPVVIGPCNLPNWVETITLSEANPQVLIFDAARHLFYVTSAGSTGPFVEGRLLGRTLAPGSTSVDISAATGSIGMTFCRDGFLHSNGNWVFVCSEIDGTLVSLNVSALHYPIGQKFPAGQIIGCCELNGNPNYALVANRTSNRVRAVDISNPFSMSLQTAITDGTNLNSVLNVCSKGMFGFFKAAGANKIVSIDFSAVGSPVIANMYVGATGQFDSWGDMFISGNYLYVINDRNAPPSNNEVHFTVLDISNPASMTQASYVINIGPGSGLSNPGPICIGKDLSRIWAPNGSGQYLSQYNGMPAGHIFDAFDYPGGHFTHQNFLGSDLRWRHNAFYEPVKNYLYVASALDNSLMVYDCADCSGIESFFVDARLQFGVTTAARYTNATITVTGTGSFYPGAFSDGDTTSGSLGVGHSGSLQMDLNDGSGWIHREPVGGPYTTPQTQYVWHVNASNNFIRIRFGDSVWEDNSGGFNVTVQAA